MLIITSSLCSFPFSIPPSWKLQRRPSQCVGQDISPTQLWPNVQPTNCLIHVRDNCWWKLLMTFLMTMLTTNAKCSSNKWPHSCSWQLLMKIADDIVDDSVHNKCQMSNQQIASFTFLTIVDDSVHNVCWWQYLWKLPNSKFPHSCRWQLLSVMMITFHTFCNLFLVKVPSSDSGGSVC